jgi:hypothetical protein
MGFTENMAQMIAQAKPSFQVQQGHTQVIPNYGHGGMVDTSSSSKKSLGVNLQGFKDFLFGEEMDPKLAYHNADAMWKTSNVLRERMDPTEFDALTRSPGFQKNLSAAAKTGHHGIVTKVDANGNTYHDTVPGPIDVEQWKAAMAKTMMGQTDGQQTPEQKAMSQRFLGVSPTEADIASGRGGEEARQGLVKTQGEIADVRAQAEAKYPKAKLPEEIEQIKATINLINEQTISQRVDQVYKRKLINISERQAVRSPEDVLKTKMELQKLLLDIQKKEQELKDLPKWQQDRLINSDKDYNTQLKEINKTYGKIGMGKLPETRQFSRIQQIASVVAGHIGDIKQITGSGAMASGDIDYFMSEVDAAMQTPVRTTGWTTKRPDPDQYARRAEMIKTTVGLMKSTGGWSKNQKNKVKQWAANSGIDPGEIDKLLPDATPSTPPAAVPTPIQKPNMGTPGKPMTPDYLLRNPEGRASGGPVSPGQPYVVGEQGPELMVPDQSGTIVPNQGGTPGIDHGELERVSNKMFKETEDKLSNHIMGEITLIDQAIDHHRSSKPGMPLSPDLLERRGELQELLMKQQERYMRLHTKEITTQRMTAPKPKGDGGE